MPINFAIGDDVEVVYDTGGAHKGEFATVDSFRSDYNSSKTYVRICMTSGDNEGSFTSVYPEALKYASPYAINEFTITRDKLNLWRKIFRGEQGLDEPDAEEIATELDVILDPPITREYTITVTGKADDINEAILGITASEVVLRDEVVLSVEMKSEKSAT